MTLASRFLARLLQLPPADTYDVTVERDLEIPMPDGMKLLADRYAPRQGGKLPTLLVRSPYGRRAFFGMQYGRLFAERGFQVLVQSVRGTFGLGGQFDPFRDERDDGLATVEWMKQQPRFSGEFAMHGPSYLGLVQWAVAREAGPGLKALVAHETASDLWPTAHRFLAGHRIRLQVSSGAHPRFARNPGTGEPLGTAKTLVPADQAVFHDPAHPSALLLPVMG